MAKTSRKSTPRAPKPTPAQQRQQEKARTDKYFRKRYPRPEELPVIHPHAAGIDLGGKTSHFVALEVDGEIEVREFGMTTPQLIAMADYLGAQGVTSVAMEATGVYWVPVYDLLEASGLEVVLANPSHAKNVPGRRKDDKEDCRWLQKLHKFGLLSASFRPTEAIRPLRGFIRHRRRLVQASADYVRRMQKVLDMMNVRPHKALADLGGATGMRILRAIVAGETDPAVLASYRDGRCYCSEEDLREELTGFYQPHLIMELASLLRLYDGLLEEIARFDRAIEAELQTLTALGPDALATALAADTHAKPDGKHVPDYNVAGYVQMILDRDPTSVSGLGPQQVLSLLAELGPTLEEFPTVKHFGSYITLAVQQKISGGKVLSSRTRAGSHPVAAIFRQAAATVISHPSDSALAAFYRRVAAKRGKAKALTALAYKIARMYYYLIKYGQAYVDIGAQAYEAHYQQQQVALLHKRAKKLGYTVTPIAA